MEATKEHWEEETPKYAHYYDEQRYPFGEDVPTHDLVYRKEYDSVEKPKHYNSGPMECWDIEEMLFGTEALCDHLRLTSYEYRFRANQKNGEEDIHKAEKCERKLKQLLDKMAMGERLNGSTKEY